MIEMYLEKAKKYIPYYWPMSTFTSRNPLHGFEDIHFKEGLKQASSLLGAKVYMEPSYYVEFYKEGLIKRDIFEKNLMEFLSNIGFERYFPQAKRFMTELSKNWVLYRTKRQDLDLDILDYYNQKINIPVEDLYDEISRNFIFCELIDIIFGKNITDIVEKEILEFVARFLDEGQTTMGMPERERGMFEAFKLYESLNTDISAKEYIENIINELAPKDIERYILNHFIKDFGWSAFIKYRESNEDYYFQQIYKTSLMDYLAIRLHFERKYTKNLKISNFKQLEEFFEKDKYLIVLKLLKAKNKLPPKYIDKMEDGVESKKLFEEYIQEQVILEASRSKNICDELLITLDKNINLSDFAYLIDKLKEEEGYIWLKSLEDSYILDYVKEFLHDGNTYQKDILASVVFCIDVRSEAIRRHIERIGYYNTYGVAGFFNVPIACVEFDKGHELNVCPAIMKPSKVIFELPKEKLENYEDKHNINYTFKKTLDALKNNPYTPFFTVEAIGWLFGINLFGKTLFPSLTLKLTSFIKAKKPKTKFTIDKFSEDQIEFYSKKFMIDIIKDSYYREYKKHINDKKANEIFEDILNDKNSLDKNVLDTLKSKYNITKERYEFQKQKLANVGYSKEEQIDVVYSFLRLIGLTNNIPKFVLLIAHGSTSDNNPFESALDCGACGGNNGLTNVRILANIANRDYVKKAVAERGINVKEDTVFIPGLHNTTTDEIDFYDIDEILNSKNKVIFNKIIEDFKIASKRTREERAKLLPYASEDKILIRAIDWSETRPEWGLSKNMGVFVGKRSSTQNIALKNRFFMQSYNWEIDDDNSILKTILSGPFIIGEWINMEYYFSTTDNERLGAGSKVYHNVVSKLGVWTGNYGDLRTGLPYQTVYIDGKPFHEPIRLLTFVEAPVEKVLEAAKDVKEALGLVLNEWVRLIIVDKTKNAAYTIKNGNLELVFSLDKSKVSL